MIRRLLLALLVLPTVLGAQQRRDEVRPYPGSFNWQFLGRHNEAARLFNAFDYGHAILYERLLTMPLEGAKTALARDYDFLVGDLLVKPPRFAIPEEAIEPTYAKVAWRAKVTFDWAHILHRQIYDAYADPRLTPAARDALIERITDYYLEETRYALPTVPKSMALMDEQPFSQIFRREVPRFNGLIWSYHWLQIGLYEAFLTDDNRANDAAAVRQVAGRWRAMVQGAPAGYPSVMPMAPAVAPRFTKAHPRAAAIFDNLHMLHDIISDILASPTIPRTGKGAEIQRQLDLMQDPTRDLMGAEHWWMMGDMMGGVGKMGGVAGGRDAHVAVVIPWWGRVGAQHAAPHEPTRHRSCPGGAILVDGQRGAACCAPTIYAPNRVIRFPVTSATPSSRRRSSRR
ncbi:MAG: hypothetical protein IPJ11_01620 [Gemmatimonadetes bacterium]|nr:hypothetical protein [Gemmatimonadota bacterium]